MDQKAFVRFIQSCRRRLNAAVALRNIVSALMIGAGAGVLLQAAAFVLPFYYVNLYTALTLLAAVLAALAAAFVRRTTSRQAALVIDSFGFEERIVTAYERLGQEGGLLELQRADAMRQLGARRDSVRIPLCPPPGKLFALAGMSAALLALALTPAKTKERAQELHAVRREAEEKEQEIEDVMDALEELAQEELTQQQQAAVEQMVESLQMSLSEYQQARSAEMLAAAAEKLDYKYGEMNSQLTNLVQSLADNPVIAVEAIESMQQLAQQMQDMGQTTLAQGQDGNGQPGAGNSQQGSGSGQDDGNGSGGSGQGDGNGQGDGDGSGQGNGDGDGSGQGNGGGDGNGQGDGDGSGQGSGDGRGTGSSSAAHDYVSVPNAIADSGNLLGNAAGHDTSEYFFGQNGLSWEGEHISHEAVIGSYEQNAYEGIAAGRYPSGMEDVIKEYFASFNKK